MEAKKSPVAETESSFSVNKVRSFVGEVKTEIVKVNWTSPEELRVYAKIVVGATFMLGLGIYSVDLIIQSFLSGLGFVVRMIGG